MEKEKRIEKNAILFYNHCKYGILAFLTKKAREKIENKKEK